MSIVWGGGGMKKPKKAIILGAGYGMRMRPLSYATPKPLMPVWGKPVLAHTLDMLERWGVQEVLINLHNAPLPLIDYVRTQNPRNVRIHFSYEPEIAGSR